MFFIRAVVSVASMVGGCGGTAAIDSGDASVDDAGIDDALGDGSFYSPGDAARPPPSCGVPIRRITVGGDGFEDGAGVLAGSGAVLVTATVATVFPGSEPLRIRETTLSDGATREARSSLPSADWNLVAAARLDRPTALLVPVGDLSDLLWAELVEGGIELTALTAPAGVSHVEGSNEVVSDGAAFLSIVSFGGGLGLMRVTRSGADVVGLDPPPGSRAYRIAGSVDTDMVFIATSGFAAEPRLELARIAADGSLIHGWQRVLDPEPVSVSLKTTSDGVAVTAAFENEVVIVRLDATLTEMERVRVPLDNVSGAWTLEAPTPALLATRVDSSATQAMLFGLLPTLSDLRSLADYRPMRRPLGWVTGEGSYVVAASDATATDVYVLCEAP